MASNLISFGAGFVIGVICLLYIGYVTSRRQERHYNITANYLEGMNAEEFASCVAREIIEQSRKDALS